MRRRAPVAPPPCRRVPAALHSPVASPHSFSCCAPGRTRPSQRCGRVPVIPPPLSFPRCSVARFLAASRKKVAENVSRETFVHLSHDIATSVSRETLPALRSTRSSSPSIRPRAPQLAPSPTLSNLLPARPPTRSQLAPQSAPASPSTLPSLLPARLGFRSRGFSMERSVSPCFFARMTVSLRR